MGGLCVRLPGAIRLGTIEVDDWLLSVHVSLQSGEVICHSDAVVRHVHLDGEDLVAVSYTHLWTAPQRPSGCERSDSAA